MKTLQVAGAFIGTVVGAGFATGQEVFQFFTVYSRYGFAGIFIATFLFCVLGVKLMSLSRRINASSHEDLINAVIGGRTGRFVDWFVTLSFLGVLVVMAAGAGAVAHEQLGLPAIYGSLFMVFISFLTVISGVRNVIRAIGLVVPFLLVAVVGVAVFSISTLPITTEKLEILAATPAGVSSHWAFTATLYVSYNILLAIAILSPLGVAAYSRRALILGGVLGGLGLGLGILAINLAVISGLPDILNYEVPMIYLASRLSPFLAILYGLILILEIYTTAVSILYGFVVRMGKNNRQRFIYALAASIGALIASQIGFSQIILTIYPLMGYVGLILILYLLRRLLYSRP